MTHESLGPTAGGAAEGAPGDLLSGSISHKDNAPHVANQARPNGNGADPIERHVDKRELEILKVAEASEREGLERIAKIYAGAA